MANDTICIRNLTRKQSIATKELDNYEEPENKGSKIWTTNIKQQAKIKKEIWTVGRIISKNVKLEPQIDIGQN